MLGTLSGIAGGMPEFANLEMKTMLATAHDKELERARSQARAQFDSIREMVEDYQAAIEDNNDEKREEAERRIHEDALSVQVRSDWYSPGSPDDSEPAEYEILLCTGGPACRIIGQLGSWREPETAEIQYQDWFTPWTDWRGEDVPDDVQEILLEYARCHYFGG